METHKTPVLNITRVAVLLMALIPFPLTFGQSGDWFYRVYMKDKGDVSGYKASDLITQRSLARRAKAGSQESDFMDFPVQKQYLEQLKSMGFTLQITSRWMNTALFRSDNPNAISLLMSLPFVRDAKLVKSPGIKSRFVDKLEFKTTTDVQYSYDRPITMLNGQALHDAGYKGETVLIAVLDGGFMDADRIESLNKLRSRNGIISTYDFVNNDRNVFESSTHGTAVLSILAGDMPGFIIGSSPGADYILLKTEDVTSEFPCEEDFWAAGAEYADSAGADVISSSLGYYEFDDPLMNYKHSDLDGNTAFVTRVADIAAAKGILVVNSAGNERNTPWRKIICPSDGDSVAAIGAVDENRIIASFSSAGFTADGRVKPDVSAMGVRVPIHTSPGSVVRGNGTSFSCPVISGMAACLIQAVPEASNKNIIDALQEGSDRYNKPDSIYGYGIPDMSKVLINLRNKFSNITGVEFITSPNPTSGAIEITFGQAPGPFTMEIFTISGKLIQKREYPSFTGRALLVTDFQTREQGMYLISITKADGSRFVSKVIKIR